MYYKLDFDYLDAVYNHRDINKMFTEKMDSEEFRSMSLKDLVNYLQPKQKNNG